MTNSPDLDMWKAEFQSYKNSYPPLHPPFVMAINDLGLELISIVPQLPCLQRPVDTATRVIGLLRESNFHNFGKVRGAWTPTKLHLVSRDYHTIMVLQNMRGEICLTVECELKTRSELDKLSLVKESASHGFGLRCKYTAYIRPYAGWISHKIISDKVLTYPGFVQESGPSPLKGARAYTESLRDGYQLSCTIKTEFWETPQLEWNLYSDLDQSTIPHQPFMRRCRNFGHLTRDDIDRLENRTSLYWVDHESLEKQIDVDSKDGELLKEKIGSDLKSKSPIPRAIYRSIVVSSFLLIHAMAENPFYRALGDLVDKTIEIIEATNITQLGIVLSDPQPNNPNQVSQLLKEVTSLADEENNNRITIGFEIKPKAHLTHLLDEYIYGRQVDFGIEFRMRLATETSVFGFAYPEVVPLKYLAGDNQPDLGITVENFSAGGITFARTQMFDHSVDDGAKANPSQ